MDTDTVQRLLHLGYGIVFRVGILAYLALVPGLLLRIVMLGLCVSQCDVGSVCVTV